MVRTFLDMPPDAFRGLIRISSERKRQIRQKLWSPEYDQKRHQANQLSLAAACYAIPDYCRSRLGREPIFNQLWPWDRLWWKPANYEGLSVKESALARIRELEKAGALIAADIDRLLAFYEL